jgi:8-oxo-dGTP diphosphatase
MIHYVLGFLFSQDLSQVVLMRKNHPEWMNGKLNGVGGQVKPGESRWEAMVREFEEEAGIYVPASRWEPFCFMKCTDYGPSDQGSKWLCDCFWARGSLDGVKTMESEEVIIRPVNLLSDNTLQNVRWMIPLALDFDQHRRKVEVDYGAKR